MYICHYCLKCLCLNRVLIITYYWPPAGGSGVQRWLKFSKYLPEYGWQPVIYTPENPDMKVRDDSLSEDIDVRTEVIKSPITEPYAAYRKIFGISKGDIGNSRVNSSDKPEGNGFSAWLANVVRSNFFIPDPRCGWIGPSVRFLREYLRNHPVDLIISTGPPHSMHLIAKKLTEHIPCPWIADFRDPWTNMFYFKHMKMLPFIRKRHRKLERDVLRSADNIIVVSETMKKDFSRIVPSEKITVITNGFDEDDFIKAEASVNDVFSLVHTGLMIRDGDPYNIWKALDRLCSDIPGFEKDLSIKLIGETDEYIIDEIGKTRLGNCLEYVKYIPHKEITEVQMSAALLLLPLRDEPESGAILTGKFFEYLAAGRPVLAIGPVDGDLGKVLHECKAGEIFEFSDYEGVYEFIRKKYFEFKAGSLNADFDEEQVKKYSRRELTGSLVDLMDTLE